MSARDRLAWVLATWFGCGLSPVAPGTAGSLGAVPLYLLVARGGRPAVAGGALLFAAVGVWASSQVARRLGRKDPQVVVIDEVAGLLVSLLPLAHPTVGGVAAGFVLFRLFDALKPWPIRLLERLPSGWGIMADDLAAGVASALVLLGLHAAGLPIP